MIETWGQVTQHPGPPVYAAVTQEDGDRVEAVRVLLAAVEYPIALDWRGYMPLGTVEAWGVQR